jgi:hypothetical protein
MRSIRFGYNGSDEVNFLFYMSEEPSEEEIEMGEVIAVKFEAGHHVKLKKLDVEFVTTDQPLGKLELLDFELFRRWEDPDTH